MWHFLHVMEGHCRIIFFIWFYLSGLNACIYTCTSVWMRCLCMFTRMGNCTGGVPVHVCTHVQVYRWGCLCICVHMCRCIDGGVWACMYTCASAQMECLCICVHMCKCTGGVPVHVCTHACEGQRSTLDAICRHSLPCFIEKGSLIGWTRQLDWLAIKIQECTCLCLPSAGD